MERIQATLLGGLVVLSGFGAITLVELSSLGGRIDHFIQQREVPMQTLTSTVTNSAGVQVTVVTTRQTDETDAQFYKRHNDMVIYVQGH